MQKLNFNINGKHYEAMVTEIEHNVAEVELNGKKYTVEVERSESVVSPIAAPKPVAAAAPVAAADSVAVAARSRSAAGFCSCPRSAAAGSAAGAGPVRRLRRL